MNSYKSIQQFVRDRKGNPRGVVVAAEVNGKVQYGWSFTNTKLGDRFDKQRGLNIAYGRLMNGWNSHNVSVPHDVITILTRIADRAKKYFKVA